MLKRRLLALLSALVMLVSFIPLAAFPALAKTSLDFPWTEEDKPMLIEQILERDGLIDGIWMPWFEGMTGSHSLTANDVMVRYFGEDWATVAMDTLGADKVYRNIYNLKAMGYNLLGYGGSLYDEGVVLDANGDVLGVKQEFLDNARRLLDMCREIGMPVMWTICFHSSSSPESHGMDAYNIFAQKYANRTVADHYAERFVRPVCQMLAEYPDVVALVAIADEPENEINDAEKGDHFGGIRAHYGVSQEDMVYFMSRINDVCKEVLPNVARTVASNDRNKTIYNGFDLDLMGHNRYDNNANIPEVEDFKSDAPVILTEYNIGDDGHFGDMFTQRLITFREKMMDYGYKGGIQWAWMHDGKNSDTAYYLLDTVATTGPNTDFIPTVGDLRHYMDDYRAEYRGETVVLDQPVLYCNEGGGYVEWIPSRQATKMDILRSTDGGKTWTTILKDANQSDYVSKNKGRYADTATPNSMYKIRVYDGKGNTAESDPTNVAGTEKKYVKETTVLQLDGAIGIGRDASPAGTYRLLDFGIDANRPYRAESNIIKGGSFESATGAHWNVDTFLSDSVKVVGDPTAPEGDKSLYFNTAGNTVEEWYTFTVPVEQNTDYVFSAWIKGAFLSDTNSGHASIGVVDPTTGKFMIYPSYRTRSSRANRQVYPTAWDSDWHLRAVSFNTGSLTEVTVALCGDHSQMWVDGLALYKNGDGIKYVGPNRAADVSVGMNVEVDTCLPEDNLLSNGSLEQGAASWQEGHGWRNGFLTLQESRYGYGTSLRYASEDPHGLYYVRWINVEPNTDYVFSFDMKVLQSGAGKFVLMNDRMTLPENVVAFEFDKEAYGKDWLHFAFTLNPRDFTRLAVGVCDLGGEALIDNLRLFKKSDAVPIKDLYTYTVKSTPKATYGKEVSVTARAEGTGLKYAWYYKDKGASKFARTTSFTGKTYAVKMNEDRDGRQVYCVITDKYGNSRKTETTTLSLKPTTLKITKESSTATYAKYKAKASVKVTAQGDGLKYQWYVKNSGASKYSKSSITAATYSVTMTDKVKNRRVYCVVTDAHGKKVQSKTFILRMAASIATQPKSTTVKKNTTAKVTVKAKGDGLKYTWYVKNEGAKKYSKSSITKSSYSVKMTAKVKNRLVYCVVKDKYGKTVKSSTVRLKMK